ncbi:hypothetical protein [Vibrio splendidus]|uniref:hypothetical protein n=1 Tax=Vibrio splendidus TaxID=29497 RepID=UPI0039A58106
MIVDTTNQATKSIKVLTSEINQAKALNSQTLDEMQQVQIAQSKYMDKCLLTALITAVISLAAGITIGILLPF